MIGPDCTSDPSNEIMTLQGLECVFSNVVSAFLGFAGILLFIMLLVGGYKFITSAGDPKALASARQTITWAILGLILIAASYLILVLISDFTGNTDLLEFLIYRG